MHSPRLNQARTLNAADAWAQAKTNASTIRDIIGGCEPEKREKNCKGCDDCAVGREINELSNELRSAPSRFIV